MLFALLLAAVAAKKRRPRVHAHTNNALKLMSNPDKDTEVTNANAIRDLTLTTNRRTKEAPKQRGKGAQPVWKSSREDRLRRKITAAANANSQTRNDRLLELAEKVAQAEDVLKRMVEETIPAGHIKAAVAQKLAGLDNGNDVSDAQSSALRGLIRDVSKISAYLRAAVAQAELME